MYMLQLKGLRISKKEISLNQAETKLIWYKEGKNSSSSIKLSDIIEVEIGITDVFLQFMKEDKFQDLIQEAELCISVKTLKKTLAFYGICTRDVQTWYDRLKIIAEVNNSAKIEAFSEENAEPSLVEFKYDKVKEVVWEDKIIPNWQKYFDCSTDEITPKDYRDLRLKYEIPKLSKKSGEILKMKTKVKTMKFSNLIMAGIP